MNEYQEAYCTLDGAFNTIIMDGFCVIPNILNTEEITEARSVNLNDLPDPQKDEDRVKKGN